MAILRGQVDESAHRVLGSGFSPGRNGGGDYTVTYDEEFTHPPVVVVTVASGTSKSGWSANIYETDKKKFSITMRNNNSKGRDSGFTFYASDDYVA